MRFRKIADGKVLWRQYGSCWQGSVHRLHRRCV